MRISAQVAPSGAARKCLFSSPAHGITPTELAKKRDVRLHSKVLWKTAVPATLLKDQEDEKGWLLPAALSTAISSALITVIGILQCCTNQVLLILVSLLQIPSACMRCDHLSSPKIP